MADENNLPRIAGDTLRSTTDANKAAAKQSRALSNQIVKTPMKKITTAKNLDVSNIALTPWFAHQTLRPDRQKNHQRDKNYQIRQVTISN